MRSCCPGSGSGSAIGRAGGGVTRVARLGPAAGELAGGRGTRRRAHSRHAAVLAGVGLADAAAARNGLAGIRCSNRARRCGSCTRSAHGGTTTSPVAGACVTPRRRGLLIADLDAVCAHLLVCERAGSAGWWKRHRQPRRGRSDVERRKPAPSAAGDGGTGRCEPARRAGAGAKPGEKVLGDPAAAEHLRESLQLTSDPAMRAAVTPDLAGAAAWRAVGAGTALVRRHLRSNGS
jgi:hypothetical protein